ncbi:MAG: ABC transporter substrate-binding protein [Rhodoferax sp.]|nr:ABC transporter substrate-binding protein [Rhodoferax sp.]MCB2028262.1 ABC transporter substrate-binding protein [Rhodoferax sp.]
MVRRTFLLGAAGAALGARVVGAQSSARPEKSRLVIALGAKASLQHLPLTIAERLNFFAAEGLEVEILDLGTGVRAQQSVMEGAADVACGTFEGLLDPLARKHLLQAFVLLARAPQVAFGVSTRTMPMLKRVPDLRGRKIALAAPGTSAQLVAALVLARHGLTLKDVQLVDAGATGAALQAVRTGSADAIVHMEPVITMLEQKGDIRVISDTRSLKGSQDVFGGPMPSNSLFAPAPSVQNHPNTMQALTHAVVHALKWLQTAGPSDLIKAVPESYLLGDRGLYLASFGKIRESIALDGLIPDEGARTAVRALARLDPAVVPGKIDLERIYTNDYARIAKEKFRA